MLGLPRGSEWIIIILVIALLFGAKRLPDAARGLGRSLRIFKAETKGLTGDGTTEPVDAAPAQPAAPPVAAPPVAAPPVAAPPAPVEIAAPKAEDPAERTEG